MRKTFRRARRVARVGAVVCLLAVACGPDKYVKLARYLDGVWSGEITDARGTSHRIVLRFNQRHNAPDAQIGDLDFKAANGYRSFLVQLPDKGSDCARVVQISQWSMASDGSSKSILFDTPFEHCFESGGASEFEMREVDGKSADLTAIGGDSKKIGYVTRVTPGSESK